jgi:transposase
MPAGHAAEFRQGRRVGPHGGQTGRRAGEGVADLRVVSAELDGPGDADDNGGDGRLTGAETEELVELRRRNRQLEAENEILKRAAAYFGRENVLPK